MPPSCALLGGFALGARVSLLRLNLTFYLLYSLLIDFNVYARWLVALSKQTALDRGQTDCISLTHHFDIALSHMSRDCCPKWKYVNEIILKIGLHSSFPKVEICQWKNFKNWSSFAEVMTNNQRGCFYYRASYALRGICHGRVSVRLSVSVCVCLCLSQVGVLLKWLNIWTHKQRHTIAQGL